VVGGGEGDNGRVRHRPATARGGDAVSKPVTSRYASDIGKGTPLEPLFRGRNGAIAAFILGMIAFLPYPALPIGGNTGLQLGDFFSIGFALPLVFLSWKRNPYYLFGLLLIPLCTSALKVVILNEPGLEICLKSAVTVAIFCITILAAQLFLPTYLLETMLGVAAAALLHVAVGAWQMYVFATGGELPLLFIYVNPSFYSVVNNADTIVNYIQRPFGLFPEPSAMSSSLAPIVLFWLAELLGLIRFTRPLKTWHRVIFGSAAVSSMLLIILSRSGHAMFTVAVGAVFVLLWLRTAKATPRNFLTLLAMLLVVLPLVVFMTVNAVGGRVAEATGANESWQDRSYSLVAGFEIWTHTGIWNLLFGTGCGLISQMLSDRYGLDAVWSVSLTYIYETGIVGAVVCAWIGTYFLRVWRVTRFNPVYAGVLFIWLVGITVTTSYNQLLPIWFTFGLLTVWPTVCTSGAITPRRKAAGLVDTTRRSGPIASSALEAASESVG
jgi:hypothetical protein